MTETYDVVIAGGAAMGSSTAYHLAAQPGFSGRVLVVEKDMSYAKAASSLSLSSVRQQFSCPVNIRVGLYGVDFLQTGAGAARRRRRGARPAAAAKTATSISPARPARRSCATIT